MLMKTVIEGFFPVGVKREVKKGVNRFRNREWLAKIGSGIVGPFEVGNGGEGKVAVFDKKMILTAGNIDRENAEDVGGGRGNPTVVGVEDLDTDAGERFKGEGIENQAQRTAVTVSQTVKQADQVEDQTNDQE
jgi:hypothetical protein